MSEQSTAPGENVAAMRRIAEGTNRKDWQAVIAELDLRRTDALVASFRGGKAVRLGYHNDQAQALKAVGLEQ